MLAESKRPRAYFGRVKLCVHMTIWARKCRLWNDSLPLSWNLQLLILLTTHRKEEIDWLATFAVDWGSRRQAHCNRNTRTHVLILTVGTWIYAWRDPKILILWLS
jgi:hypothetical protein